MYRLSFKTWFIVYILLNKHKLPWFGNKWTLSVISTIGGYAEIEYFRSENLQ